MQNFLSPMEIAEATIASGHNKTKNTILKQLLLGIMAGIFISLGAIGATIIGAVIDKPGLAKLLFAGVFPVGLMLVIIAGAELFTGNNLMTMGVLSGRYSLGDMLKNWCAVYLGNLLGSIFIAILVVSSGIYSGAIADKAMTLAYKKTSLIDAIGLSGLISRAILCNMVVVLAVWMATGARDIAGKILAIWFPIMLFVLSGFEHSIANMFFLYSARFIGAQIGHTQIWLYNLIPVTLGNIIGGAIIVPIIYYCVYVRKNSKEVAQ